MAEIKYEIIKSVGVLSRPALSRVEGSASGWAKELNLISWNDRDAKYPLGPFGAPPPNTASGRWKILKV